MTQRRALMRAFKSRLLRGRRIRRRPISERIELALDVETPEIDRRPGDLERFLGEVKASATVLTGAPDEAHDVASEVRKRFWYHTIELPDGIVTPGTYDHRPLVRHYGLPEDLRGKRALDVGTWDGFWAFELERRGADVVAIDIDRLSEADVPGRRREALAEAGLDQRFGGAFEVAKQALGSQVRRVGLSVYDLGPDRLGMFDVVHVGEVLLHLEAPTAALRRVRSVTGGVAIISTSFDPRLGDGDEVHYRGGFKNLVWWLPSLRVACQWVADAGFADVRVHSAYRLRSSGQERASWRAVIHARPSPRGQMPAATMSPLPDVHEGET